ncbi:MAG: MFS transporter [Planctomycetota bacterium]
MNEPLAMTPRARLGLELYPLGYAGPVFANTLFMQWIVYFHAPPTAATETGAAASPAFAGVIGLALLLSYLAQALWNPVIGNLGDRVRTRFGQRRPFILVGVPLLALGYYALWQPGAPFGVAAPVIAYGILFTTVLQPYTSLLPTMAPTHKLRARFAIEISLSTISAGGVALLVGPALLEQGSFSRLAWVGAAAALTSLVPALLLVEPTISPAAPKRPDQGRPREEGGLWAGALELCARPLERGFFLAMLFLFFTIMGITILTPYLGEAVLGKPRAFTQTLNAALVAGMILGIPFVAWVAPRFGDARLLAVLCAAGGGMLMATVLACQPWQMAALSPEALSLPPTWLFGVMLFGAGVCVVGAMVVPALFLSRLSDRDGKRRDGMYFGLHGLFLNVGNAAAAWIVARLVTGIGAGPHAVRWGVVLSTALCGGALLVTAALVERARRRLAALDKRAEGKLVGTGKGG